jgi:hypothetical protein
MVLILAQETRFGDQILMILQNFCDVTKWKRVRGKKANTHIYKRNTWLIRKHILNTLRDTNLALEKLRD